ncbi:glycosyltransferase family 25 protein [Brucella grignonensis]|uniref:Glycosyltransferase 25 family protein n=1 Tax=Brucella grignonensis TaxID=94627 RepID=A0A256F7X2_9HYPH|nr:glycosyltransferase family 25 protein [Brucella grignonensis]OYR10806.1 glycosyltransferase 25 family protein [Brucella grignonensis]
MNIKAFIIHLARSTDRKPQVEKLIHELPVKTEVIDAVDSRALTDAEIGRVYKPKLHAPRYPFELSKNEIACFLSHRKAWQAIVDQQLDAGFVIEDDIELTDVFNAAFHAVSNHFEPGSFVRFTFRDDREDGREVFRNNQVRIIIPNPIGLGMVAQLVSFDAAKKLLAITEQFDRPVDTTIQMRWVTDLQPLAVIPGGVKEISAQLGGTTIQHKKSLSDKLKREILRPIYRMRVRGFSSRSK